MSLLKTLQMVPVYLQTRASGRIAVKRLTETTQCRCLCFSSAHLKKKRERTRKTAEEEEPLAWSVKNVAYEQPILFNAIRKRSDVHKQPLVEPPFFYRPELKDDTSHLGKRKKRADKKEHAFILQPRYKYIKTTAVPELRLAEAKALVSSVSSWSVHEGSVEPIKDVNAQFFFGKGKVAELATQIREAIRNDGVTMVFVNTNSLTLRQAKELELYFGCKVFDRYRVVLEIFKEKSTTKEANLQVQLAEFRYLRKQMLARDPNAQYDRQGGGGMSMSGGGEKQSEIDLRRINDKMSKVKKEIALVKKRKEADKLQYKRLRKGLPHIAVIGYTNAGKTTLTKLLTRDESLEGENTLFATLDCSNHRGRLRCGVNVNFIDTVGFISDMPHELIESFATTLEDVRTADVLVHVMDCSHPELEVQKETVSKVLERLDVPDHLMDNIIKVSNKIDKRSSKDKRKLEYESNVEDGSIVVSARDGTGIDLLHSTIQNKVLQVTGREQFVVTSEQDGTQYLWLREHGTVYGDLVPHEDGTYDVHVILDPATKAKYEYQFSTKLEKVM